MKTTPKIYQNLFFKSKPQILLVRYQYVSQSEQKISIGLKIHLPHLNLIITAIKYYHVQNGLLPLIQSLLYRQHYKVYISSFTNFYENN